MKKRQEEGSGEARKWDERGSEREVGKKEEDERIWREKDGRKK